MSNMSYCRWRNTAGDMHDCVAARREGFDPDAADTSDDEKVGYFECLEAAAKMLALAAPEHIDQLRDLRDLRDAIGSDDA